MPADLLVFESLQIACSQNPDAVKLAEVQLKQFETEPGYHKILTEISLNATVEQHIRLMAAVNLKLGVDKYWRSTAKNAISNEEKLFIKAALLTTLSEPSNQLANYYASVVSRVVRIESLRDWADLIPTLVEWMKNSRELQQQRSLMTMVQVVKAVCSKRLPMERVVFEEFSSNMFEFTITCLNGFTVLYFQSITSQESTETCLTHLQNAVYCLKILKKFILFGSSKEPVYGLRQQFFKSTFQRCKELLECRLEVKKRLEHDVLLVLHEKYIIKHLKILCKFLESNRHAFVELVPTTLEFAFNYSFFEGADMIFEGNKLTFPMFVIHCMNLMKEIAAYPKNAKETDTEKTILKMKNDFYSIERLGYICDKLITHYFLLTPQDVEAWDENPEVYVLDEGGEPYKYNLRACTEAFYMTLFVTYRNDLIPYLVKFIQKSQEMQMHSGSSSDEILLKEAIYNATGLTSFTLFNEIDFDEWFTKQLIFELSIKDDRFKILRKRIIWLIGQWTDVKFDKSLRPQVYRTCVELLHSSEDMAVRITASKTLKSLMDSFEFNAEQFLVFLEQSFELLFMLLKEANECDTKMNVLYLMSFIIEKMSMDIRIQAMSLVHYLPLLWAESEQHNMLRVSIISALLQIIKSVYDIPEIILKFIYDIIQMSCNINEPSHVYLIEEGLELWLLIVQNSPTINDELLQMSEHLIPIMENSSTYLRTSLYIVQAYVILNAPVFLEKLGPALLKTCHSMMGDMRAEGIIMVVKLFSGIVRAAPSQGSELMKLVLLDVIREIYKNDEFSSVTVCYLGLISRILLSNQLLFSQTLEEMQTPDAFERIMKVFLAEFNYATSNDEKKLLALALTSLITVPSPVIYDNFPNILYRIGGTLIQIMKDYECEGVKTDILMMSDDTEVQTNGMYEIEDYEFKTPHYERCRQLSLKDPVHTIVLKDCLQIQLINLRNTIGEMQYKELMQKVEDTTLNDLVEFIDGGLLRGKLDGGQ